VGFDYIGPQDGLFMVEVLGVKGQDAVSEYSSKSLLAFIADECLKSGTFQADRALEITRILKKEMLEAMAQKSGRTERFYRQYINIMVTGVLRNLALVAQRLGDKNSSGILRLNAKDMGLDAAAAPEGLLSLAAWDAGNRYPGRGLEIIHQQVKRYPSLEVARFGLDVFAVRVGRERVGMPGM
jgi:hypothetical protein